jgi:tRNA-binding protein
VSEDAERSTEDVTPASRPLRPDVTADDFHALDVRVGRVVEVEPFPEARRPSWKLTVDFGPLGRRRTSAQVTNYPREDLLGRQVVAVLNLGSRRIAGFTSEFLVLGAIDADGTVRLLLPDADVPDGSPVE